MSTEDFINIIKVLEAENIELTDKNNQLQAERDKILIQIGKGTLDWIIKKKEGGNRVPFEES
jgi:hypothetical protein